VSQHLNQKGAHKRPICTAGQNKIVELSRQNNEINELVYEIFQSVNIPTIGFISEGGLTQMMSIYVDPSAVVAQNNVTAVNNVVADVGADSVVGNETEVVALYVENDAMDRNVEEQGNVAQGNDVIKLREENRAMREQLYRMNAEKTYWKRSAKRMRSTVHWTTQLLNNQGENLEDSEDSRNFEES